MSVVIKTSEMQYRDGSGAYHGINAIAEKKIADQEAALDAKIASTQSAVNSLEAQKNTIAATIASMAQLGTDTTLTTPGMAADAAKVGDLKSALNAKENNGHTGIKYTGMKYANDNTTVSGSEGSIAVYRIEQDDIVTVFLKANSSAGININRDGIALSNNPVPTIGETIARIGSTHAMSSDTTITFKNKSGYKYLYVYYSAGDISGDANTYVTVTTVNKTLVLMDEVKEEASGEIAGVNITPCKINAAGAIVTNDGGTSAVYKIAKNSTINISISYDATKANRVGIGLGNKAIPESGDTPFIAEAMRAVTGNESLEFCNRDYDYMYVYFTTNTVNDDFAENLVVTQIALGSVPYGYTEITSTWNQGTHGDASETKRIITDLINSDPIGRKWKLVVPNGFAINIFTFDEYGTKKDTVFNTLQTGTVEFVISRKSFKILMGRTNNASLIPVFGNGLRIYRMDINNQYGDLRYTGKRVSLMGDSISTYGSIDDASETGDKYSPEGNIYTYPGNLVRYPQTNLKVLEPQQTYWLKAIVNLGMTLGINESIAGSTVAWDGTSDNGKNKGADYCMSSYTRINHLDDNGTPDIIIINGGTNDPGLAPDVPLGEIDYTNPTTYTDQQIADWSDPTSPNFRVNTFYGAYQTMLIRMMKAYPLARIICLLPNFATYTVKNLDNYCEAIKEMCDLYGIKWIDIRTSGITPFNKSSYMNDGMHPNYNGMQLIGDKLTRALLFDV